MWKLGTQQEWSDPTLRRVGAKGACPSYWFGTQHTRTHTDDNLGSELLCVALRRGTEPLLRQRHGVCLIREPVHDRWKSCVRARSLSLSLSPLQVRGAQRHSPLRGDFPPARVAGRTDVGMGCPSVASCCLLWSAARGPRAVAPLSASPLGRRVFPRPRGEASHICGVVTMRLWSAACGPGAWAPPSPEADNLGG